MMTLPSSSDKDLAEILNEIENCKTQLPEFQRKWIWDDNRIRGIIASITQGYPMGALMFMAYDEDNMKLKYRTIEGVQNNGKKPEMLILDGQQRLTSIFLSAKSLEPVPTKDPSNPKHGIDRYYYLDINKCLDMQEDRLDAVVSVPADKKIKENFNRDVILDLSTRDEEYTHEMFPLNIVFNSNAREDWADDYKEKYGNSKEVKDKYKAFRKNVLDVITSYKLPVITLPKGTSKEAVCRVFENVNTGGVALTVFELVTAMYAIDDFDLRKDWDDCKKEIRRLKKDCTTETELFDNVDETAFLTTVCLYASYSNKRNTGNGGVSCKKKDVLGLKLEDYKASRNAILEGFRIAKNFLLKYQYIFASKDLPYTSQIIPLAAICAFVGESKCNEQHTIDILSRWYWCGIFGEMYGGSNETRYANDIEDVVAEIENKPSQNRTINAANFSANRLLQLKTRNSAAYKGVMGLLYKAGCRDFLNDTTVDIHNMFDVADIHHIFPEDYCSKVGIDRDYCNSIINKTPIMPKTNRSIGGKAPSDYITDILSNKKLDITEAQLKSRVESHLVNYEYLKGNNFKEFFVDRAKKLLKLIENAMGKQIADRGTQETINNYGATLESEY